MSSFPAEGRPVEERDLEALVEIVREVEASLGLRAATALDDLRHRAQGQDLVGGSLVLEREGRPVAFGWLSCVNGVAHADGLVRPAERGHGLGSAVAAFCEERASALGAETIRTDVYGADLAAAALLAARGYEEVDRFYDLALELVERPEPVWPPGVEPAAFRPEDAESFHAVTTAAFAGGRGFVALPFEEWWSRRLAAGDDISLWALARAGEEVVGAVRCEPERRGLGWVATLAVAPERQGSGLGRALLLHAFGGLWERGRRRIGLNVHAGNTRALRLYESVGMRVELEDVVFAKRLAL